MKLLVATSNRGKLVEVREILAGGDLQLTSLADLGLTPPEEPFETFHESACANQRGSGHNECRAAEQPWKHQQNRYLIVQYPRFSTARQDHEP